MSRKNVFRREGRIVLLNGFGTRIGGVRLRQAAKTTNFSGTLISNSIANSCAFCHVVSRRGISFEVVILNRIPLPALMPWRNAQFRRILNAIVPVGLLLLIILCGFLGHAAESPFAAPNDEIRYDNLCGPNCLYMLLEILGHSVTREEWQSWRPSNTD